MRNVSIEGLIKGKRMIRLNLKLLVVAALLLLSALSFTQAATYTSAEEVRVSVLGKGVTVYYQGASTYIPLTDHIKVSELRDGNILYARNYSGSLYLVLDVAGNSYFRVRGWNYQTGTEAMLVWLKLDSSMRVQDIKTALYTSYWQNTFTYEGYQMRGPYLRQVYHNVSANVTYDLQYNNNRPDAGFYITTHPLSVTPNDPRLMRSRYVDPYYPAAKDSVFANEMNPYWSDYNPHWLDLYPKWADPYPYGANSPYPYYGDGFVPVPYAGPYAPEPNKGVSSEARGVKAPSTGKSKKAPANDPYFNYGYYGPYGTGYNNPYWDYPNFYRNAAYPYWRPGIAPNY